MSGVAGRSGRVAKPLDQHALDGTRTHIPGKFRNPATPMGDPEPPDALGKEARAEWVRMLERMRMMKILSPIDAKSLSEFCQVHALAVRLQKTVDDLPDLTFFKVSVDGAGVEHVEPKIHPAVAKLLSARLAVNKLLKDFGLTPDSRGRVRIPTGDEGKEENALERLHRKAAAIRRVRSSNPVAARRTS